MTEPEPVRECPLCKRTFIKESTQKRHFYYCRSKKSQLAFPRRRSCTACIRAKTRCTWLASSSTISCSRCRDRGLRCEYDVSSPQSVAPGSHGLAQGNLQSTEDVVATTSAPLSESTASADESLWTWPPNLLDSATTLSSTSADDRDLVLDYHRTSKPDNNFLGSWNFSPQSLVANDESHSLATNTSSSPARSKPQALTKLFSPRTLTKIAQVAVAVPMKNILQSYPFMLLRKETLPPFVNPMLFSWAESGEGPPLQTLTNCVSLVHMFKTQTEKNKAFRWRLVRLEQERILSEHSTFDRWELLAAVQALLVYCLLRLREEQVGDGAFDAALLMTVDRVGTALAASVDLDTSVVLPKTPHTGWIEWMFYESWRRTGLIFKILNMLVDISAATTSQACSATAMATLLLLGDGHGYALLPLASNATLWTAGTAAEWEAEFRRCREERTIYGVTLAGQLRKLWQTQSDDGVGAGAMVIKSGAAEWEEWSPGVGEIGSLVMIAATFMVSG